MKITNKKSLKTLAQYLGVISCVALLLFICPLKQIFAAESILAEKVNSQDLKTRKGFVWQRQNEDGKESK